MDGDTIMIFGATPFASTTFAGVGIQNVVVLVNGKRVNINVGNTAVSFGVQPTGNRFNLATGSVSVIGWSEIDPNATGTWVPIDPLNP